MVPDGLKKRLTLGPDKDASRIGKRIFDKADAGTGTLEIIRTLNNEGISSSGGKLLARVFPGWESVVAAGSVGWARAWLGQARRGRLSAAV